MDTQREIWYNSIEVIDMPSFKDLTGEKFGRLAVIRVSRKVKSGNRERYYWQCKCDCGNEKEVRTDCLTNGLVKSCGCLKKEQDKINLKTADGFRKKKIAEIGGAM